MLLYLIWLQAHAVVFARRIRRSERGQATAEYALVLLGVAAVAVILIGWAVQSGKIEELFDAVFDNVTNKVK